MYCDDIALITDNFEDMQNLIGIVSEFMTTFGIDINTKKSFYTKRKPTTTRNNADIAREEIKEDLNT